MGSDFQDCEHNSYLRPQRIAPHLVRKHTSRISRVKQPRGTSGVGTGQRGYEIFSSSQGVLLDGAGFQQGFSTLALLTCWTKSFFIVGGCFVHRSVLRCSPGLYSVDASSNPTLNVATKTNVLRHCYMSSGNKIVPGCKSLS